jgi:hypothetical protein
MLTAYERTCQNLGSRRAVLAATSATSGVADKPLAATEQAGTLWPMG